MVSVHIFDGDNCVSNLEDVESTFDYEDFRPFYCEFSPKIIFGETEIESIHCSFVKLRESGLFIGPQKFELKFLPGTLEQRVLIKMPGKNYLK